MVWKRQKRRKGAREEKKMADGVWSEGVVVNKGKGVE